jgi:hypothetical protein
VGAVSREDLSDLVKLGHRWRLASIDHALAMERAYRTEVAPSRLAALESIEQHAWQAYRSQHSALLAKLEGEEFDQLVAPIERPTIYTLEELEALPDDTVVVEENMGHQVFQKLDRGHWSGDARSWYSEQIHLPVTVVWSPES